MHIVKRYLDGTEVAKLVGMTPEYIRQLKMNGRMPEPDILLGSRPGWSPERIEQWKEDRKKSK